MSFVGLFVIFGNLYFVLEGSGIRVVYLFFVHTCIYDLFYTYRYNFINIKINQNLYLQVWQASFICSVNLMFHFV